MATWHFSEKLLIILLSKMQFHQLIQFDKLLNTLDNIKAFKT